MLQRESFLSSFANVVLITIGIDIGSTREDILSVPVMTYTLALANGLPENGYSYDLWIEVVDTLGATTQFFLATVQVHFSLMIVVVVVASFIIWSEFLRR